MSHSKSSELRKSASKLFLASANRDKGSSPENSVCSPPMLTLREERARLRQLEIASSDLRQLEIAGSDLRQLEIAGSDESASAKPLRTDCAEATQPFEFGTPDKMLVESEMSFMTQQSTGSPFVFGSHSGCRQTTNPAPEPTQEICSCPSMSSHFVANSDKKLSSPLKIAMPSAANLTCGLGFEQTQGQIQSSQDQSILIASEQPDVVPATDLNGSLAPFLPLDDTSDLFRGRTLCNSSEDSTVLARPEKPALHLARQSILNLQVKLDGSLSMLSQLTEAQASHASVEVSELVSRFETIFIDMHSRLAALHASQSDKASTSVHMDSLQPGSVKRHVVLDQALNQYSEMLLKAVVTKLQMTDQSTS
jgi:hypothetical protein